MVNCNLQRLDGPVLAGNGKIVQELEAVFRGAGWNWRPGDPGGRLADPLIASDTTGLLLKRMEEAVDGEYQDFKSKNGAWTCASTLRPLPGAAPSCAHMPRRRNRRPLPRRAPIRGKVYAAYAAAVAHIGHRQSSPPRPSKGYWMHGEADEARTSPTRQKKMGLEALRAFRDRSTCPSRI